MTNIIKVVSGCNRVDFETRVNELLEQGWQIVPNTFKVTCVMTNEYEDTSYYIVLEGNKFSGVK